MHHQFEEKPHQMKKQGSPPIPQQDAVKARTEGDDALRLAGTVVVRVVAHALLGAGGEDLVVVVLRLTSRNVCHARIVLSMEWLASGANSYLGMEWTRGGSAVPNAPALNKRRHAKLYLDRGVSSDIEARCRVLVGGRVQPPELHLACRLWCDCCARGGGNGLVQSWGVCVALLRLQSHTGHVPLSRLAACFHSGSSFLQ